MSVVESANELKELPLYALLAYVARCARRVSPLFRLGRSSSEAETCRQSILAAIRLTEELAAGNEVNPDELWAAEEGTMRAVAVANEASPPDERAAYAADTAFAAIAAARVLLESFSSDDPTAEAERIAEVATIARDAAISADERVAAPAHLDWEMLHRMFLGKFPDCGDPVDASETGILGPLFQDQRQAEPQGSGQQLQAERTSLENDRDALRRHVETLETERATLEKDREQHRQAVDRFEVERKTQAEQSAALQNRLQEFEANEARHRAATGKIEADRQAFEKEREAERAKLESDRDQHRQQIEKLEVDRRTIGEQTAALQARLKEFEGEQARHKAANGKLESELQAAEKKLQAERAKFEAERGQSGEQAGKLESERRALAEQTAQFQKRLKDFELDQARKKETNVKFEAQMQAAEKQLRAERARLETDREQHRDESRKFEAQRKESAAELGKVQEARRRLDDDRKTLTEQAAGLKRQLQQFENERKGHGAEIERLAGEKRRLAQQDERARADAAAVQKATAKLDEERTRLQADRQLLASESEKLRREVADREARLLQQGQALEVLKKEQEQSLAAGRGEVEAARQQVRSVFESLQNERRAFVEEKLHWKPATGKDPVATGETSGSQQTLAKRLWLRILVAASLAAILAGAYWWTNM